MFTDEDGDISLFGFAMMMLMAIGGLAFLSKFLWPNYGEERQRERERDHAYLEYLNTHQCEHTGHISVSRGRQKGAVYKQYRCDNGLFLDYEIRDLALREMAK